MLQHGNKLQPPLALLLVVNSQLAAVIRSRKSQRPLLKPSVRTLIDDGNSKWPNTAFLATAQRFGFGQILTQLIPQFAYLLDFNDSIVFRSELKVD